MKKIIYSFFTLLISHCLLPIAASAQPFKVDTLQYKGDRNKYINLVIMGDGYTASHQAAFKNDAQNLVNYVLGTTPWSNYKDYFNVIAIEAISNQSGAKHPQTASDCNTDPSNPLSNPDNYFGSSFDNSGIHRLIKPTKAGNILTALGSTTFQYGMLLIVVNTPYYGGAGGGYATIPANTAANDICVHEIAHSFGKVKDEYYPGDAIAGEAVNMTKTSVPSSVVWTNWVGSNGISVYQHCCGGNSAQWYKPANANCKMEVLNKPYCSVCKQAIIESIHKLVNPVVSYTPVKLTVDTIPQLITFSLTQLMKPIPNTLRIQWTLDGNMILKNIASAQIDQNTLSAGAHTLIANVTDTTSLLRVDNHSTLTGHFSTVTWTINKSANGIEMTSTDNKITCSIYPNPSSDILNISVEMDKKSSASIELVSMDGKIVQHITDQTLEAGTYSKTVNVAGLAQGTYTVVFKIGGALHTQAFVKQ